MNTPPSTQSSSPVDLLQEIDELIAQAQAAMTAGEDAAAAELIERILALDPNRPRPLQWLAAIRFRGEDFAGAAELLARAAILRPGNFEIRHNLAIALAQTGQLEAAIGELRQVLLADSGHVSARLHLSLYLRQIGERTAACGAYLTAKRQLARQGATLDRTPPALQHLLAEGEALTRECSREAVDAALAPHRHASPDGLQRIEACFNAHIERQTPDYAVPQQRPSTLFIPGLQPRAFFEREEFAWLPELEAAQPMILEELLQVLSEAPGSFQPYIQLDPDSRSAAGWGDLNRSIDWSAFHLVRHGRPVASNASRVPRTMALLERLPLMRISRHAPEVLFSVLRPHSRIPPHFGSINGRLIVHLPLIVPKDCGALCVDGEARSWETGRCLIFDDSFMHEAWNDSDQLRVVMLLDIWNPQLSAAEQAAFADALAALDAFNVAALGEPEFVFD